MKKIIFFILFCTSSSWATTTFLESGTDATLDTSFYPTVSNLGTGLLSSDSSQSHSGPRALKCASGVTLGGCSAATSAGVLNDAGTRLDFWIFVDSFTTTNQIASFTDSSALRVFALRVGALNTLSLNNGAGTTLGTAGVITIPTNTWTRVTVSYTISSVSTYTMKVFINGVLDANATNSTALARTGSSILAFAMSANTLPNVNTWFDDVYVDNSVGLSDPGDIRVTNKRPYQNGTTNGFSGSGTPSTYGTGNASYVNEQPLSTSNLVSKIGAGSAVTEEYTIEGKAAGDVDITPNTLIDYVGWIYSSSLVSETASIIIAGASSNVSLTSTNTLFEKAAGSTSYPTGTTDVGEITDTSLTTVSLYEAGVLFAYSPFTTTSTYNTNGISFNGGLVSINGKVTIQ